MNAQSNATIKVQDIKLEYFFDPSAQTFTRHQQLWKDVDYPWEVLENIEPYIQKFFSKNQPKDSSTKVGSVYVSQDKNIVIGEGTTMEHGVLVKGPCIIGNNCTLRKGVYIRENVILGDNCLIGNSAEIKNSILLDQCEISHLNYVGDSVLGSGSHLAGGAITSNFKLGEDTIHVYIGGKESQSKMDTKLKKFGAIVGDGAQIGCNSTLNPGTLIGKRSWVYPQASFQGLLPSDTILKHKQQTATTVKKVINSKL